MCKSVSASSFKDTKKEGDVSLYLSCPTAVVLLKRVLCLFKQRVEASSGYQFFFSLIIFPTAFFFLIIFIAE